MNGRSPRPVLRVLESDAAGLCEPDDGACAVPGVEPLDAAEGETSALVSSGDDAAREAGRENSD